MNFVAGTRENAFPLSPQCFQPYQRHIPSLGQSLSYNKTLHFSRTKTSARNKINVNKIVEVVSKRSLWEKEKMLVTKFFSIPTLFLKAFFLRS